MNKGSKKKGKTTGGSLWDEIYWWAFLVVAVLAVPSVGFIVAAMVPDKNIAQLVVFVLTCWACTYLGMRLMKK